MRHLAATLLLTLAGVTHAGEGTGTIAGTVRYLGEVPPAQKILTSDGATIHHNDIVVDAKTKGLRHVAVYLDPKLTKPFDKKAAPVVVDQRDMLFMPRVVIAQAGQTVRFENNDLSNHAVKADGKPENTFNVTTPPGQPYDFKFAAQKGPVAIGCPIHTWMQAWVYVVPHPYHCVTDAKGAFRINGLPPGKHKLILTHPDTRFQEEITVEVEAGRTTELKVEWRQLKK